MFSWTRALYSTMLLATNELMKNEIKWAIRLQQLNYACKTILIPIHFHQFGHPDASGFRYHY